MRVSDTFGSQLLTEVNSAKSQGRLQRLQVHSMPLHLFFKNKQMLPGAGGSHLQF
jgi:hypothetical protein